MNKKGISEVVTSVLLIVIAIVAVIIIWQFISKIVKDTDVDTSRLTVDLKITNVAIYNENVNVSITRNVGEGNIVGLAIKFDGQGESYTYYANSSIKELENVRYNVSLAGKISYLEKVSIAPIVLTKKGKQVVGSIIDVYKIEGAISG